MVIKICVPSTSQNCVHRLGVSKFGGTEQGKETEMRILADSLFLIWLNVSN